MRPLNPNFHFTVKLNNRHVGGEFQYLPKNTGLVRLFLRGLKTRNSSGTEPNEHTAFLRLVKDRWIIWDTQANRPMQQRNLDETVYAAFREAYSLAMIED
jgi:hypothetical protein